MYTCDQAPSQSVHVKYIGHTTTTITEPMKQHILTKNHHMETHHQNITSSQIIPTVAILAKMSDKMDLATQSGGLCSHPEWPRRQCVDLAFRRLHVRGSLSAASLVICSQHCTVQYVELRGYCPVQGGRCDKSIGSTVSDAIVRSWFWSTATSSPLGYFSKLLQVVDN